MDPGVQNVATEAYFALELQGSIVSTSDKEVLAALTIEKNANFTVEAWVQPYEITSLEPDDLCVVARRLGYWEIGFTGDGRVYGEWVVSYNDGTGNSPFNIKIFSPNPVNIGKWLYISMTVSSNGDLALYEGETLLAYQAPPSGLSWMTYTRGHSVEIGGSKFHGRFRNLIVSRVCKESTSHLDDPSKDVRDFSDSIYYAAVHSLPPNAVAAFNLLHPVGDPEDPTSAVPLCCLHVATSGGDPKMTTIDLPKNNPRIALQTLTAAMSFDYDAYVSCGRNVLLSEEFSLEAWVKVSTGERDTPQIEPWTSCESMTIASCGAFNEAGMGPGWSLAMRAASGKLSSGGKTVLALTNKGSHAPDITLIRTCALPDGSAVSWLHVVLTSSGQGTAIYVNGSEMTFKSEQGGNFDPKGRFVGSERQTCPLIIGAKACGYNEQSPIFDEANLTTKYNWNGHIKLVRVWKQPLQADAVKSLYDLDYEPADLSQLSLYADLDTRFPSDLALNSRLFCSDQTDYDDCVVSSFASGLASHGGDDGHHVHAMITDVRTLNMISKENRRLAMFANDGDMTIRAFSDGDNAFLAGFLPDDNIWFNVIDLTANIFFIVLNILTKARANKKALANLLNKFFGKSGVQIAKYIKQIVRVYNQGLGIQATMTAVLDLAYFFGSSGWFKGLLGCFEISWFAILRLVGRFIPWVGTVALLADIAHGIYDVYRAITRFMKVSTAKLSPLTLMLNPSPLTERYEIVENESMVFSMKVDHQPGEDQVLQVNFTSNPASALSVQPSSFTFNRDNWGSDNRLTITCLKSPEDNTAYVATGDRFKLLQYTTSPAETFFVTPDVINATLTKSGDQGTLQLNFTVVWTGPADVNPEFDFDLLDDKDNVLISNLAKKPPTVKVEPPLGRTRGVTKRIAIDMAVQAQIDALKKAAAISTRKRSGGKAKNAVKPQQPEFLVDIYMINAGSGDGFYLHFTKKQPQVQGDGTVKMDISEATMIVDGGHGEDRGKLMWSEVDDDHLPKGASKSQKGPVDLVIATHQDNDHIGGLQWMYRQMKNGQSLGPTGTETVTPRVTWLNQPYGDTIVVRAMAMPSLAFANQDFPEFIDIGPEISIEKPFADLSIKEAKPAEEPTVSMIDPAIQPTEHRLFAKKEATTVKEIIEEKKWPVFFPTSGVTTNSSLGPLQLTKAGVIVTLKGPSGSAVLAAETNPNDKTVNNASIINEINGADPLCPWSSLWVGDSYTSSMLAAVGLTGSATKHYTILKVGHHGSELSNKKPFFAKVTADHYLISCDGSHNLPREDAIQWILDGHHTMRKKKGNAGRPAPTIWVNNPLDKNFTFDYKGGRIFQRNSGASYPRKSQTGSLRFRLRNGVLDQVPMRLPGPTDDKKYFGWVTEFTRTRGKSKRATYSEEVEPPIQIQRPILYPDDRSKLLSDERQELERVDMNKMQVFQLCCSQSFGARGNINPADAGFIFTSELGRLTSAASPPGPIKYIQVQRIKTPGKPIWSISTSNDKRPPRPPAGGPGTQFPPGIDEDEFEIGGDNHIMGVTVWGQSAESIPTGFTFHIPTGNWASGVIDQGVGQRFDPPGDGYRLAGVRSYAWVGAWVAHRFGQPVVLARVGFIWQKI